MCFKNNRILFTLLNIVSNLCLFKKCATIKRVAKGIEVECGTQPRVASLRNTNSQHLCGATLLSPHFALTSAHCVQRSLEEYVLLLNNYCYHDEPPKAYKISSAYDIAILRIRLNLADRGWLYGSVLPTSSFGLSGECQIYRYGYKEPNTMDTSDRLLAGKLRILSLDQCTKALGPFVAPEYDSGMMCALGEGVDAFQGDSGSPLFCAGHIQGVSSYGISCAGPGLPGVYTSVGAHLHWIQEVTKEKGDK